MFDKHHPARYHHDPDRYPLGLNDLEFVGVFDPENDRDQTPLADRWLNVLWFFEAEIRALHRQLAHDRQQFTDAEQAALAERYADSPYTGLPSD